MRFAAQEPAQDNTSVAGQRALSRAIERGVNFIHSSLGYGTTWAISEVLRNHPKRHEIHHIIKVGVPDFDDGGKFDSAKFRLLIEETIAALGAERIAVVQHLHRARPNSDELRIANIPATYEPLLEIFEQMRQEGKVEYLTSFPYSPGYAAAALKTGSFAGMVAYYNVIELEMAEYFAEMQEQGRGFFCIRPFMGGLLTDRRAIRSQLPEGDRMTADSWDASYERLELLKSSLGIQVESWTQFAIKFALIHPIVSSLIVGLNTVEQVDEVLDAADGNYPDRRVYDRAQQIFRENGMVPS